MTTGYTRQVAEIAPSVPAAVRRTAPVTAYRSTHSPRLQPVSGESGVVCRQRYGYYSTQQGYLTQLEAVLSDITAA